MSDGGCGGECKHRATDVADCRMQRFCASHERGAGGAYIVHYEHVESLKAFGVSDCEDASRVGSSPLKAFPCLCLVGATGVKADGDRDAGQFRKSGA